MAYGGSALEQMEGFFTFTTHQCHAGRCICPFGAFSVDYADLPEEVRNAMGGFMDETIRWLTKVLELGREQGSFSFDGEAKPKALLILSGLQGARQLARIHGMDVLDDVVRQVRQDLGLNV